MQISFNAKEITCDHCGEACDSKLVRHNDKNFCCDGCKSVYDLINNSELCEYYQLEQKPGFCPPHEDFNEKWAWLNTESLKDQLVTFSNSSFSIVVFNVPNIHCYSCIYLLENLHKIHKSVISSEVDFNQKEVTIRFKHDALQLSELAAMLNSIGYPPLVTQKSTEHNKVQKKKTQYSTLLKIGVAGFCMGNIMLFSFPEYLDSLNQLDDSYKAMFGYLNFIFALPVLLYSAKDYFISSVNNLLLGRITMEFPIALGITSVTLISIHQIFTHTGAGYFDSMTMFVFMLLVAKFFQDKTTKQLSFNNGLNDYFPLAVNRVTKNGTEYVEINKLEQGNIIEVKNKELIPADAINLEQTAVDYSFITGESEPILAEPNTKIYAGAKNAGKKTRFQVLSKPSESYLRKIWDAPMHQKSNRIDFSKWSDKMASIFSISVLVIAAITSVFWAIQDASLLFKAVSSVLIVACPCVLALTVPFTFGALERVFAIHGLYLKSADSLETLAKIDVVVFDKTGTLTENESELHWQGKPVSLANKQLILSLAENSSHPVCKSIIKSWNLGSDSKYTVNQINEEIGAGIEGTIDGHRVAIGKAEFVANKPNISGTVVTVDGELLGNFSSFQKLRNGAKEAVESLQNRFKVYLLSGDEEKNATAVKSLLPKESQLYSQNPENKMDFIAQQQKEGKKVLMIGDGLNDGPALQQADFAITIAEKETSFTPSADAIMLSKSMGKLPQFSKLATYSKRLIFGSFIFSGVYNAVGIGFAVSGLLQPWVAAILMPISSLTVILYTQLSVKVLSNKYLKI
jgi:Cu+-exporting ATPase